MKIFILEENKWDKKLKSFSQYFKYETYKSELIYHKKKNQRYTVLQKILIYKEYWENASIKEIKKKYNSSISSIYKIIRGFKN